MFELIITTDDLRQMFIQHVQINAIGNAETRRYNISDTIRDRFFNIYHYSSIRGLVRGLLAYRLNSHDVLDDKRLEAIAPLMYDLITAMMLSYSKSISKLDKRAKESVRHNYGVRDAFEENSERIASTLKEVNDILVI